MSRNPYLAASRPSTYARTSRTKSNLGSNRSPVLSRSRSSATIGSGYSGNSYNSAAGYAPVVSWQRSVSSSRASRSNVDSSKIQEPELEGKNYELSNSGPSSARTSRSTNASSLSLDRSYSSQDLSASLDDDSARTSDQSNVMIHRDQYSRKIN